MKGKLILSSIEFLDIFCNEAFLENEWYKVRFPTEDKKEVVFLRNGKETTVQRKIKHHMLGSLFQKEFEPIWMNSNVSKQIFFKKGFPLDESEYIVWISRNKSKHLNIQCKMGDYHMKKIRLRIRI